ncbi:MAG: hypothetical protein QM289_02115 [Bacillota bacterium]|jgi:uncharacterized Zn finger protein|nr:hypothetical protein [Bacillota bacterium]NLM08034.1 hypothetical protein [Clostridiales Family XIII bacterium]HAF59652.1 hypothetical protein [Clostridiales bacterium UBA9856]HOA42381.1 hypothetical protein [Bacillota bacterium]HPZ59907.1 hypothetical protein [Bacillota bacterium]
MEKKLTPICNKCQVELAPHDLHFSYLDHNFRHKVLRCPECGQVYLSEDVVAKIKRVETNFEEK